MPQFRPASDSRNNFADISKFVDEVYFKLLEAELEAKTNSKRYSHKEVFNELRARITGGKESRNV